MGVGWRVAIVCQRPCSSIRRTAGRRWYDAQEWAPTGSVPRSSIEGVVCCLGGECYGSVPFLVEGRSVPSDTLSPRRGCEPCGDELIKCCKDEWDKRWIATFGSSEKLTKSLSYAPYMVAEQLV
eukprot:10354233-Karenia_brevis.AAC.1